MANPILDKILSTGVVEDEHGKALPLGTSNISVQEGQAISGCIGSHGITRTLEVGCAYGISSLYICEAISKHQNSHHIMIDPAESGVWQGIGIRNLQKAGFTFWQLIEQPSALALPALLASGAKVQFALIDGLHTFDQVMVDFFYIDQLLDDGGIVAFDDVPMTPVNRVVRYVLNYPNYHLIESVNDAELSRFSLKHKTFDAVIRVLASAVPSRVREEYFADSCLRPSQEIGLRADMVFLQKRGEDHRSWDWYKHF